MIIGIGTDIVEKARIAKIYSKYSQSFILRISSQEELPYLQKSSDIVAQLSKLWAIKEAFVKALGTGFNLGVTFQDIVLYHNNLGAPELKISGKALSLLQQKTDNQTYKICLSVSDEKTIAQAVVIIEKY